MKPPAMGLGQRYEAVFRMLLLASLCAYGSYLLMFAALGIPTMPAVNAAVLGITGLAMWWQRHARLMASLALMSVAVIGHALIATWLLGWTANFHLFMFLVLVFLLLCPRFPFALKVAIFIAIAAVYGIAEHHFHDPRLEHVRPVILVIRSLNTVVFAGILGFLAHTYARAVQSTTQELEGVNADLLRLATTDALTGLLNRRSLSDLMAQEIARFRRNGRAFSVVLGDIDDFKRLNDAHGHQAGDAALVAVAGRLHEAVRTQDRVARWGGEEFLVFLPETGIAEAETVAERIRHALNARPVAHGERAFPVRMTFGVAEIAQGQSLDEVLVRADRALYAGKRAGKDRIVRAQDAPRSA
ncbi:MAG: GGDEF domain-containing protein [Gammaproteobacteria bacterium]